MVHEQPAARPAARPTRSRCRAPSSDDHADEAHDAAPPAYRDAIQHLPPPTATASPTPAAVVEQNEGVWQPTGRLVGGHPAVYTTYVRPDAVHTSYYTGLMWLDTKLLQANYVVGLEQPGGGPNPWGSQIPEPSAPHADRRVQLRLQDGLRQRRRVPRRQDDGAARRRVGVVRDQAGRQRRASACGAATSRWAPDIKAVRQNLVLIVDNGAAQPRDAGERHHRVRRDARQQGVYVWRSGVGRRRRTAR